jgi:hypothetical protein
VSTVELEPRSPDELQQRVDGLFAFAEDAEQRDDHHQHGKSRRDRAVGQGRSEIGALIATEFTCCLPPDEDD